MDILDRSSLAQSVNNISRALIRGSVFTDHEKAEITAFLIKQRNPKSGFTFFPTQVERIEGIQLVTGEKAKTQLLADNALELETLRLLALFRPEDSQVMHAIEVANQRLKKQCFYHICTTGECAAASIVFLRYITALPDDDQADKIKHGLAALKQMRDGKGRWKKFPFFYTLLWLTELTIPEAKRELAYTLPACQSVIKRYENANDETSRLRSLICHNAQLQITTDIHH